MTRRGRPGCPADRRRLLALLAAAPWAAPLALRGADARAQGRTPVIVTRLVKVFLGLEADLQAALAANDAAVLDRLLAPDFEVREAARPGSPVPRADVLARIATEPEPAKTEVVQMAAHELPGGAVNVSFLLLPPPGPWPARFMVDTWLPKGEGWQLKVRYVAIVRGAPPPPVAPAGGPRPTGKG